MFMFRKKTTIVSTSAVLQIEAKKFQEAVAYMNSTYKPHELSISIVEGIANKFGVDASIIASSIEVYLRNNAINAIKGVKATSDYTVLNLEQAAEAYGFDLETLGVTFFSQE